MTIKVAADISILGSRFDGPDPRHGIYNVIEEVLIEVCRRDDIEMTAVGLCGSDPLADSIKALLYLEHKQPPLACAFDRTFRVRPGLTTFYAAVFHTTLSGTLNRLPAYSARRIGLRCAGAFLYRMSYYRVLPARRVFDHQKVDVFHCPHPDLPPKEVTGDLPRVITIYDVIPVVRPTFVTQSISDSVRVSLGRIDVNRDWVVCISEFTKQEFCAYSGMSADRVIVARPAAARHCRPINDPHAIAATRARVGIPEGEYFLSLAAPQPRKNLAHLIRSFFRLLDEGHLPDTYLVLAGSKEQGWMYDDVVAAARSSPMYGSRVIFTGYVPDDDLSALYSGAAAFVFPSLYEGFGMPPLEAMACGTAVITSNTSSLPEVVGGAGVMVDPCDQDALCQAMLDVLTDESLRRNLGHLGLERARAFTWEQCAEETVRAYKAAADQRRA